MSEPINLDQAPFSRRGGRNHRRRPVRCIGTAHARDKAKPAQLPATKPGAHTSFASLKQIDAGVLNVGIRRGRSGRWSRRVILLHGWPYDIYSFVDVAPLLASAGYRVIVPYLRGYGTTRFLSNDTLRNGQPSAIATDIDRVDGCAQDREGDSSPASTGARGRPTSSPRFGRSGARRLVSVSGYLIGSQEAGKMPLPPKAELQWWYQFYFATERGRARLRKIPARFCQADLAARFAEMGFRRRHLRSQRGGLRQSGSCRDRDPQLPLAARPRRRRGEI